MRTSKPRVAPRQIDALRQFNRFYTQRLGILAPYLGSDLTLTEVRVLYELAHAALPQGQGVHAAQIGALLGLDAGYLSRILRQFEARRWIKRSRSPQDGRQHRLALTQAGRRAFLPLQDKSIAQAGATLSPLAPAQRRQLIAALGTVHALLDDPAGAQPPPAVVLREPQAGDYGWVVEQHGALYAREYGWNQEFEALVAGIVAGYLRKHRPDCERGWIAEQDGQRLGCAFVVRKSDTVAQLRLVIVVPQARGLGLGGLLTDTCMAYARDKGYRKMVLWTNSCLHAARAIYAQRGFVMRKSEPYQGFGQDLVSETWDLRL